MYHIVNSFQPGNGTTVLILDKEYKEWDKNLVVIHNVAYQYVTNSVRTIIQVGRELELSNTDIFFIADKEWKHNYVSWLH